MICRATRLFPLLMLQACGTAGWDIEGVLPATDEKLVGAASRYLDGGTIELYGTRNTHCNGTFTTRAAAGAKGKLLCDDRRSGAFTMNLISKKGEGTLNGSAFSFTLEKPRKQKR